MTRRGFSLIETIGAVVLLFTTLAIVDQLWFTIGRQMQALDADPWTALERSTWRLHQDALGGWSLSDDQELRLGDQTWHSDADGLRRNDLPYAPQVQASWALDTHGALVVSITCDGHPSRSLRFPSENRRQSP
jgi:hypothetical protein